MSEVCYPFIISKKQNKSILHKLLTHYLHIIVALLTLMCYSKKEREIVMEKRLKELLEIAKNGTKEDVLAYLPNLEVEYNADHTNGQDRYYVVSCYDDLESYLDGKDNWEWEDLQEDLIALIETYLSIDYEENGLVITDYDSMADGYLPWHNSEIKSEEFLKQ